MTDTNATDRLMEMGRQAHLKTYGTVKGTAAHYGVAEHAIYAAQAAYRGANGIVTENQQRVIDSSAKRLASRRANAAANADPALAKKERDRIRHKAAREAKRAAKGNGHANGHQLVPTTNFDAVQARVSDLQAQLDHAMEEMHTLQKILMTVGKAL